MRISKDYQAIRCQRLQRCGFTTRARDCTNLSVNPTPTVQYAYISKYVSKAQGG